jgi:hypothetical protein
MAADSNAGTGAQPHDDTRVPFTSFSLSLSLRAPAAPTLASIPSTIHLPTQISTLAVCTLVWFRADLRLHDHEPLHAAIKTGMAVFVTGKGQVSSSELVEMFLMARCRSMNCKSVLPVDD